MAITTVLIVLVILFTIFLLVGVPIILGIINAATQKPDCSDNQKCPEGTTCRESPALYCETIECGVDKPCKDGQACYNGLCYSTCLSGNCNPENDFLDLILVNELSFKLKSGNNYISLTQGKNNVNPIQLSPTSDVKFSIGKDGNNYYLYIASVGVQVNSNLVLVATSSSKYQFDANGNISTPCQSNCAFTCQAGPCVYAVPLNVYQLIDNQNRILVSSLDTICKENNCKPRLEYIKSTSKWAIKVGSNYLGIDGNKFILTSQPTEFDMEVSKADKEKLTPLQKELFKKFLP